MNLLKGGRQIAILTSANGSKILAALPNNASPQLLQNLASITSASGLGTEQKLDDNGDGSNKKAQHSTALAQIRTTPKQHEGDETSPAQNVYCLRTVPNNIQFSGSQANLNNSGSSFTKDASNLLSHKTNSQQKGQQPTGVPTAVIISSPNRNKGGFGINFKSHDDEIPGNSKTHQQQLLLIKRENEIKEEIKNEINEGGAVTHYSGRRIFFTDGRVRDINTKMLQHQQQIALEKQLRLQKSLSEECEDLGVDEPEDLFPEAELLFDSLEHTNQDSVLLDREIKVEKEDGESSTSQLIATDTFEQYTMGESDLGASTEVRTTRSLKKVTDMYEYTDDGDENERLLGDNTDNDDVEYNRFFHKKLGRISSAAAATASVNKRKRISSSPTVKKSKVFPESEESQHSDVEHNNEVKAALVVDDTKKKKSKNTKLTVSIDGDTTVAATSSTLAPSPVMRRLSPRNHVKKNCDCCKKKSTAGCTHGSSSVEPGPTVKQQQLQQPQQQKNNTTTKQQAPIRIMSRKR